MLMGHGEYILPDNIPANEFLNLMGDKISTSRGWALWVLEALEFFPADYLRFGLASILPEFKDADFDLYDFQTRIHRELADNLGNFIHRTLSFIKNYLGGRIPELHNPGPQEEELLVKIKESVSQISSSLENFRFRQALKELLDLSREGNRYFDKKRPWATRKTDLEETEKTLAASTLLVKSLTTLMEPFLPFSAEKLRQQLQLESIPGWEEAVELSPIGGRELRDIEVLFTKIPDEKIEKLIGRLHERTQRGEVEKKEGVKKEMVTFEEFKKLDLRIGKIVEVEDLEGTKKLYKLRVDLGQKTVTLVAGLKEFYKKEDLLNKEIVVVANLEPATIRGVRSEGMLLAAVENGKPVILIPEKEVAPGTSVS